MAVMSLRPSGLEIRFRASKWFEVWGHIFITPGGVGGGGSAIGRSANNRSGLTPPSRNAPRRRSVEDLGHANAADAINSAAFFSLGFRVWGLGFRD